MFYFHLDRVHGGVSDHINNIDDVKNINNKFILNNNKTGKLKNDLCHRSFSITTDDRKIDHHFKTAEVIDEHELGNLINQTLHWRKSISDVDHYPDLVGKRGNETNILNDKKTLSRSLSLY